MKSQKRRIERIVNAAIRRVDVEEALDRASVGELLAAGLAIQDQTGMLARNIEQTGRRGQAGSPARRARRRS
jgi:hypothetical protein